MLSIGIVGCGAIGRALLEAAADGRLRAPVAGIHTRGEERARGFLATLRRPPPLLDLPRLIEGADLLVEAAGGAVVRGLAEQTFAARKALMVISIGALLECPEVIEASRRHGCRLYLPSGAIAGLDGIKSACAGPGVSVEMTTRKPPEGLTGAPFLIEHGISLDGLAGEREVFAGSAREACRGFPSNVNVAAAVSLAGVGADQTRIRIIAVPGLRRNCHEIRVEGGFGRIVIQIENTPTENPRTGRLTILSLIRSIHDAADPVRIGT